MQVKGLETKLDRVITLLEDCERRASLNVCKELQSCSVCGHNCENDAPAERRERLQNKGNNCSQDVKKTVRRRKIALGKITLSESGESDQSQNKRLANSVSCRGSNNQGAVVQFKTDGPHFLSPGYGSHDDRPLSRQSSAYGISDNCPSTNPSSSDESCHSKDEEHDRKNLIQSNGIVPMYGENCCAEGLCPKPSHSAPLLDGDFIATSDIYRYHVPERETAGVISEHGFVPSVLHGKGTECGGVCGGVLCCQRGSINPGYTAHSYDSSAGHVSASDFTDEQYLTGIPLVTSYDCGNTSQAGDSSTTGVVRQSPHYGESSNSQNSDLKVPEHLYQSASTDSVSGPPPVSSHCGKINARRKIPGLSIYPCSDQELSTSKRTDDKLSDYKMLDDTSLEEKTFQDERPETVASQCGFLLEETLNHDKRLSQHPPLLRDVGIQTEKCLLQRTLSQNYLGLEVKALPKKVRQRSLPKKSLSLDNIRIKNNCVSFHRKSAEALVHDNLSREPDKKPCQQPRSDKGNWLTQEQATALNDRRRSDGAFFSVVSECKRTSDISTEVSAQTSDSEVSNEKNLETPCGGNVRTSSMYDNVQETRM